MPNLENRILNTKLSRRKLLTGSALTTGGVFAAAAGIERSRWTAVIDQWSDWKNSDKSNEKFLTENRNKLKNLKLGCSFSPEEFGINPQNIGPDKISEYENVFKALDVIIDDLGITDIRFGIRWSNAVDSKGNFNFSFYKPFVDHCLEKGANICLNIGPLKTFRYPEEHPPQSVLQNVSSVPSRGQRITPDMDIAKEGVLQMMEQLEYVKNNYDGKIGAFQSDNEPNQSSGQFGWVMGSNYMISNIELIHAAFPNSQILVNAANPDNIGKIATMFKKIIISGQIETDKLIFGYDYYYKKPKLSDDPIIRWIDPITRARLAGNEDLKKNRQDAKKYGYKIEVTEGQAEAWKPYFSPGSSAREFRFMLLRCMNEVLDMSKQSLLRIWGAENVALNIINGDLTDDHNNIIELIKKINPQKPKLYLF
ncbi:MAG: hypothetical protein COX79_00355 [Candidatus Levybacteria bacterium CG_4_10_14_0_2_um_filter_36_16]|nr:MAG: hypothetical protein AUK12_04395 [Candidatus Levybacteria bacterium CG2_30_37_29]PIZ97933.1 MAG: hypothetical protein COX79_00355 [Candidatus Levybacteria bacterium CG_4_10_14_0_2_um_filter_36_16]